MIFDVAEIFGLRDSSTGNIHDVYLENILLMVGSSVNMYGGKFGSNFAHIGLHEGATLNLYGSNFILTESTSPYIYWLSGILGRSFCQKAVLEL